MTPIFQTSYSTLSAIPLGSLVSGKYGWDKVECRFLLRGVSDTYTIATGSETFILRIYRSTHRNLSQINAELELLTSLKNAGVSASYPVPDLEGNFIFTVQAAEGTRHAVIFTYAPGKFYSVLNENQLKLFGREMAKFHLVSSRVQLVNQRWNFDFETTLIKPLRLIKDYFKIYPEGYTWLQRAVEEVQNRISKIDTSGFTSAYCHFDFFPKNFHFEGDTSITFFDFDFFGYGWLVNDIMTFWQHLCLDVQLGRMPETASEESFKIFLAAYGEIRPLRAEELSAVPLLSLGFWLFYFGFYTTHDQFLPLLQDPHLIARTNLVRQLMERHSKIVV